MTTPRRRAARTFLVPPLAIALALALAACGSTTPATPRPSASPSAAPQPSLTAVPGEPSPAPSTGAGSSIALPSTTETDFGRIWDALPPSFPTLPGQEPADPGSGPTSGAFALNMDVATASAAMRAALTSLGWTADVGSPLEDGTVVLEASGPREGCVTEVRFTPLSGTVVMSVLYGADCPFS